MLAHKLCQALGQAQGGLVAHREEEGGALGDGQRLGQERVAVEVFGGHLEGIDNVGLEVVVAGFASGAGGDCGFGKVMAGEGCFSRCLCCCPRRG